jgi:nucleoside-diphosphate-sugar epimerase
MNSCRLLQSGVDVKRLFDLVLALCAVLILLLLLLLPVVLVAMAVHLTSKGPAVYWSARVGRKNSIFKMPKFRSIWVGTPAVAIIYPPLVYGPGDKANFAALMRAVRRGWPLPLGAVHNQRSLVALNNLVDFIVTCMTHPQAANQTFLVSDGQDLSTTELVRGMAQAAGVPARLLPVPVWALQAGASLLGKGDAVQRLCGNLQVDTSKARSLLGWVPPVSVEEGLRRAMAV